MYNNNNDSSPGLIVAVIIVLIILAILGTMWDFHECRKVGHGFIWCLLNK